MEKFFYYNDLFAIYGKLLTLKEQEIFSTYYEENLSMSEIALNRGISRSAVGNTIKISEKKLDYFEKNLRIAWKNQKIKEVLEFSSDEKIKKELEELLK